MVRDNDSEIDSEMERKALEFVFNIDMGMWLIVRLVDIFLAYLAVLWWLGQRRSSCLMWLKLTWDSFFFFFDERGILSNKNKSK